MFVWLFIMFTKTEGDLVTYEGLFDVSFEYTGSRCVESFWEIFVYVYIMSWKSNCGKNHVIANGTLYLIMWVVILG